jgi:nitric oxide reductase subunit C
MWSRKLGMGAVSLAFVVQSGWVWFDTTPSAPMEGAALAGARLWHEHNCQACHQIYGYGGFLGPDLTNAASRFGDGLEGMVAAMMAAGPGAMPRIEASPQQVDELGAWLRHIDATGRGQARSPDGSLRLADVPWWEFP